MDLCADALFVQLCTQGIAVVLRAGTAGVEVPSLMLARVRQCGRDGGDGYLCQCSGIFCRNGAATLDELVEFAQLVDA